MAIGYVMPAMAQRPTDHLDRGLVAVKTSNGVFCSWRIKGEEYEDATYNLYRDGVKLNDKPLEVSNFSDASGTLSNKYSVAVIIDGKETERSEAVSVWENNFLDIPLAPVMSKTGKDITSQYVANDVSLADVDGDGKVDFILKRINKADNDSLFAEKDTEFTHFEIYSQQGKRLWWIDCGPNMVSGSNVEVNAVGYDWDGDGKAEVLLRGADGMILHTADGQRIMIGDSTVNTRNTILHRANMTYTNSGAEYLLYLEGATGKPYQIGPAEHPNYMDYPLTRGQASDWGDSYGHRSSKYFFGAPFLDGRHASIFLARGIYTKHKMAAYDVDPATHKLTQRWYWTSDGLDSKWFGQGYHNYGIADVDWDGRDEIVYGSMVIDDNGKGLSSTGLGHGDAQHCGDFNPFIHGQEIFACNEDNPNNNYRDATTSKIYYRTTSPNDDGRSMMANFTDDVIGSEGATAHDAGTVISSVTNNHVAGTTTNGIDLNFRIYWDGDLCDEAINGDGNEGPCVVHKYGSWTPIERLDGTAMCNWTKNTPSAQGDILGDWREEIIMRTSDNKHLRVYTTTIPTSYRIYSLWGDMQYRQAMVWEALGYNQPPHLSYFLGKAEGITTCPPMVTMTDRTEVANGGSISASLNGKNVLLATTSDAVFNVASGVTPKEVIDNAPSWVQGANDNDAITYTYYTHTLKGAAFSGNTRIVKQGDGTLVLPNVKQTYSGDTKVWAGTLSFDGEMTNSHVWLNRFARLCSDGGSFDKSVELNYGSQLLPGGKDKAGEVTIDSLTMNMGAELVLDLYADGTCDKVKANTLALNKVNWTNGPAYLTPVVRIVPHFATGKNKLDAGDYLVAAVGKLNGQLSDVVVEGLSNQKATLAYKNGNIYVSVLDQRDATTVEWSGANDTNWNTLSTENFQLAADGNATTFCPGDTVVFDDNAKNFNVNIAAPVSPAYLIFNNSKNNYTISGDSIRGNAGIEKNGSASATLNNVNRFTSTAKINAGRLVVKSLANSVGNDYGSLGGKANGIVLNGGALVTSSSTTCEQPLTVTSDTGMVEVAAGTLQMAAPIRGGKVFVKKGGGELNLTTGNTFKKLVLNSGITRSVEANNVVSLPDTVVFNGGTLYDNYSDGTSTTSKTNFQVSSIGYLYLDGRCNYTGSLRGKGEIAVYATFVRNYLMGNWSKFEGTVTANWVKWGAYNPTFDFKNSYGLPKAVLNVNGIDVNNDGYNFSLGNLAGSGSLIGSGTWTVGSRNENGTFTGQVKSPFVKIGSGDFQFSAPQTEIASVAVKGGRLVMDDTDYSTDYFNQKTVTVADSGTVAGCGLLNGVTVSRGGSLTPGVANATYPTRCIKVSKNVTVSKGGTLNFCFINVTNSATSRSYLDIDGSLVVNGTVNVTKPERKTNFKVGDSIIVWIANKVSGNPEAINLPTLPDGLYWDTSSLMQPKGVIKVTDVPTAIHDVSVKDETTVEVYALSGAKLMSLQTSPANLRARLIGCGLQKGTYLVRMNGTARKINLAE